MTPEEALRLLALLASDYAQTMADKPGTQSIVLSGAQAAHHVLQRVVAAAAAPAQGDGNPPA